MDEVETLCAVLGEEARVCMTLLGVLRDEQQAVAAHRPGAIFACVEQREALQDELAILAARRRALVREVARACGSAATSAPALLPLLAPDRQARLRGHLRRLRRTLLAARGLAPAPRPDGRHEERGRERGEQCWS